MRRSMKGSKIWCRRCTTTSRFSRLKALSSSSAPLPRKVPNHSLKERLSSNTWAGRQA
jgi:hypothetical protein